MCGAAFAGACIRVGLVLGALWLSLPQITYVWSKTPRWLLIVAGVALVVPTRWHDAWCYRVCVVNPLTTEEMLTSLLDDMAAFVMA